MVETGLDSRYERDLTGEWARTDAMKEMESRWGGDCERRIALVKQTVDKLGDEFKTFLDATGLPHSDEMRTIEQIRKTGKELEIIITIHDPEMYERDWQARFVYQERNDVRIEEYACNDNHRDLSAVKGVEPQ